MNSFTNIIFVLPFTLASLQANADLIGSDAFSTNIGTIDYGSSAQWDSFGATGAVINGLAYNPNANELYGVSAGNGAMFVINQSNGRASQVGENGALGYSNVNGLAYDSNHDILYATDNNTDDLFSIDTRTGESTYLASIGNRFTEVEGLAYDSDNDVLYGLTAIQSAIISIDVSTGEAREIASLPDAVWRGLSWDAETGSLALSAVNIFNDASIYRYDIGRDSLGFIGNTSGVEAIQGLAFTNVPAPAGGSLMLATGLIAGRRRR